MHPVPVFFAGAVVITTTPTTAMVPIIVRVESFTRRIRNGTCIKNFPGSCWATEDTGRYSTAFYEILSYWA
jgi:hypothetical protein